jgi:hypothetical protein
VLWKDEGFHEIIVICSFTMEDKMDEGRIGRSKGSEDQPGRTNTKIAFYQDGAGVNA